MEKVTCEKCGTQFSHQRLPARRAVTEQEEQEMAASVHEFAMRSRLPSDMRRTLTGETNDS